MMAEDLARAPSVADFGEGSRQRADRHQHPGGRRRRARRREDRRAARRTRARRAAPGGHRRHRQRAAPARGLAAAARRRTPTRLLLVGDHVLLSSSANQDDGTRGVLPRRARQHRRVRRRHLRPGPPAARGPSYVVGAAGLDAAVRRHGPPGHHHRPAAAALRPARRRQPQRAPGRAAQPRDRAHLADRGLDPGTLLRRRLPPADLVGTGHGGRVDLPTRVDAADASQVGVTGAGSEVYSSTDRLYVTSTDWGSRPILRWRAGHDDEVGPARPSAAAEDLHPRVRPRRRQHPLRRLGRRSTGPSRTAGRSTSTTATSASPSPGSRNGLDAEDNGIAVLDEHDGRLEQVGALARARRSARRSSRCAGSTTWRSW